ncbi:MAG: hypothetical protein JXA42_16265 [Anaerolineales bacterium]|nr:hypothetical protein [Anaerolineales bacterium]
MFDALIAPISSSILYSGITDSLKESGEIELRKAALSRFELLGEYYAERFLREGTELLLELNQSGTVAILERNLCRTLAIEALERGNPTEEYSSWWRNAIEETGQDQLMDYKDVLLVVLRDALTIWAKKDSKAVSPLIQRYLTDRHQILRRLGLYLLFSFPEQYRELVIQELGKPENLNIIEIKHEFFILLARGYPILSPDDQIRLVETILQGPPPGTIADFERWSEQREVENPEKYIEVQKRHWVGVRLWMIRDYLAGEQVEKLTEYVKKFGEPDHPTFSRWHSEAYMVRDVSPLAAVELKDMTPEELLAYMESFMPPPDDSFGPERTSHRGLAEGIASVILENPDHYSGQLVPIARHRPEYAIAILERLENAEPNQTDLWEIGLQLCEELLDDQDVRTGMTLDDDSNWREARSRMVNLIQSWFNKKDRQAPMNLLPRARDLLLLLLDDPSPDTASDRPPAGYMGHMDPVTVAINTIRPKALLALLDYARYRVNKLEEKEGSVLKIRLEQEVREALDRKLDREQDPSWAVHAVYGMHLHLLYLLDEEWFISNLDRIFPQTEDEKTCWYFAAAWDAFVTYSPFYKDLFELLREKYKHATECLERGIVTQGINQPQKHLANHLVLEYLLADYEPVFDSPQTELLVAFFNCHNDSPGHATWSLWRAIEGHKDYFEHFWPRSRALWEWRVREASNAGHSTDFDDEMEWLAKLPMLAPEDETMTTLWPLLEGMLPHVSRPGDRNMAWDDMTLYLEREVERDPVHAIQYYLLMHQQGEQPTWQFHDKEARKIIETAAANEAARKDALELIDLLARRGDYGYRDIYDSYAG